jgi:hypothetical protein
VVEVVVQLILRVEQVLLPQAFSRPPQKKYSKENEQKKVSI